MIKCLIFVAFMAVFVIEFQLSQASSKGTKEPPHWSVNNIQFSNSRQKRLRMMSSWARTKSSTSFGPRSKPWMAKNDVYSLSRNKIMLARPPKSAKLMMGNHNAMDHQNALRFLRTYLVERQKQRQLSARLMSSFGTNVVGR